MRVSAGPTDRLGNASDLEQLNGFMPSLFTQHTALDFKNFSNLFAHHHERVQSRHRLLKHKGNVLATDVDQLAFIELHQIPCLRGIGGVSL